MFWHHKWQDPITGDELGLSDRLSWIAQGIIRRWIFVIGNIALSILWWTHPTLFGDDATLVKWMCLYSLLAVVIESIVGIGMYSQTRRDASILREIRSISTRIESLVKQEEEEIEDIKEIVEENLL